MQSARMRCKSRSEFKAPKTALSHGLTGLAAIKAVANQAMFWGLLGKQAARVQSGFRVWALASAASMSAGQAQRCRMEWLRAVFERMA